MKLTATIITLNEEANIRDCLESLAFVDEIVVLDSGSDDRTREICTEFPKVRFLERDWQGFGRQKNLAAEEASNDWILNIDADERVSDQLRDSLLAADLDAHAGFKMARENYFGQKWVKHCGWYPDLNLRLYDRRRCRFNEREVHEAVQCPGQPGLLEGNLVHYTYRDIGDYLRRMDRYSSLAAGEIVSGHRSASMVDLLFRPPLTFIKMYLLRGGMFDGYTGFLLSVLYANYTFVKYAKARELRSRGDG